jgi:AcrR family transcriptional regulator
MGRERAKRSGAGRPINADAAATRKRMLDAATRLFAARGFGKTSIRMLADEAGVSVAMVSHYFGGKDALFEACLDEMYRKLGTIQFEFIGILDEVRSLSQMLEQAIPVLFRFTSDHEALIRLVMRTAIDTGLDSARIDTTIRPLLTAVSQAFAPAAGRSPTELRFAIQTVSYAISRYTIASREELLAIADLPSGTAPEKVYAAVEEHLIDLAHRAIGVERESCA